MSQTFREKFANLEPERRARIVLGMTQRHQRYLSIVDGASDMPYDASEYLIDEETIEAYLAEARRTEDPQLMMEARVDAASARRRLSLKRQGATSSSLPERPVTDLRHFRSTGKPFQNFPKY